MESNKFGETLANFEGDFGIETNPLATGGSGGCGGCGGSGGCGGGGGSGGSNSVNTNEEDSLDSIVLLPPVGARSKGFDDEYQNM